MELEEFRLALISIGMAFVGTGMLIYAALTA